MIKNGKSLVVQIALGSVLVFLLDLLFYEAAVSIVSVSRAIFVAATVVLGVYFLQKKR